MGLTIKTRLLAALYGQEKPLSAVQLSHMIGEKWDSCSSILKRLCDDDVLERVAGAGPRGGWGYSVKKRKDSPELPAPPARRRKRMPVNGELVRIIATGEIGQVCVPVYSLRDFRVRYDDKVSNNLQPEDVEYLGESGADVLENENGGWIARNGAFLGAFQFGGHEQVAYDFFEHGGLDAENAGWIKLTTNSTHGRWRLWSGQRRVADSPVGRDIKPNTAQRRTLELWAEAGWDEDDTRERKTAIGHYLGWAK